VSTVKSTTSLGAVNNERNATPAREPRTLPEIVAAYERVVIIEALARCGGSRTRAAESLGVRREQLYRRIRILGVNLAEVTEVIARSGRKS
jgi:DNA-binding NtrC family response regulator